MAASERGATSDGDTRESGSDGGVDSVCVKLPFTEVCGWWVRSVLCLLRCTWRVVAIEDLDVSDLSIY